ncbi:MAG: hypothetical protein JNM27_01095 [Leptospirales bacterium]|nr:hypothetical protein [Leptospirales bacterium]
MRNEVIQWILLALSFSTSVLIFIFPESELPDFFLSPVVSETTAAPETKAKINQRKVNNPLFTEYTRIGKEYNVDMEFTGVVRAMVPYDRRLHRDSLELELFCEKEKSLDVLLIGDSTMAWGVIPSVIEQRSGLRVGMFAMRSMYLNETSMRTTERLQKYYLKPGGMTLFGFAIWTQLQDPGVVRRGELRKFNQLSDDEFLRFVRERRSSCNVPPEPEEVPEPRTFSRAAFEAYSNELGILRKDLRKSIGRLRETTLARDFRQMIHPSWYTEKLAPAPGTGEKPANAIDKEQPKETDPDSNEFGDYKERISLGGFQFIRWDNQTLTATGPFSIRSIRSTVPPDPGFRPTADHRLNADALRKLSGRKAFIISFYSEHRSYAIQRAIYATLYKDDVELLDLGEMHPEDRSFAMDNEGHPANLGGLEKSLLIAEWLRKNFRNQK